MIIKDVPWIYNEHKEPLYNNVTVIKWVIHNNAIENNQDVFQTIALINNVHWSGKVKYRFTENGKIISLKKGNGTISFIDLNELNKEYLFKLIQEWDASYPILIYCDINGIELPEKAIKEISTKSIVETTGPIYYFDMGPIRIKRVKRKVAGL